jgi:hypothetical protein
MARNGTAPRLLVSTPIEDRLQALEDQAAVQQQWSGEHSPTAATIRMCVREMRGAIAEAEEIWRTTAETSELTRWSTDTLLRHAKNVTAGGTPAHAWRGVRVRMSGTGYLWMVSTVPAKPAKTG